MRGEVRDQLSRKHKDTQRHLDSQEGYLETPAVILLRRGFFCSKARFIKFAVFRPVSPPQLTLL